MKFSETKILSDIEFKVVKIVSITIVVLGLIATLFALLNGEPDAILQGLGFVILGPVFVYLFLAFFALGARYAETKGRDREIYLFISIITSPLFAALVAHLFAKRDERSSRKDNNKFDPTSQLMNLSELLKNGMITQEEFDAKKMAILDKM